LLRERGEHVASALLLQFYHQLPERKAGSSAGAWSRRLRAGLLQFQKAVESRYTEGTLLRLAAGGGPEVRHAAVLALNLTGTMQANAVLAARLGDEDREMRRLAADAMWSIWFRADEPANNKELQRLMRLTSADEITPQELVDGFAELLRRAPNFAEAYNQRAILYYRLGDLRRSIQDCERALKLNPHHFGAASGVAQCLMKQKRLRAALRAYRRAYRLNPNLEGIRQTILSLERMLGEEGKK
jgi:tetratricopeptide (TPR) repeat protein